MVDVFFARLIKSATTFLALYLGIWLPGSFTNHPFMILALAAILVLIWIIMVKALSRRFEAVQGTG